MGFISDLPTHLIEAFKATLEEVVESDLLIHVLDISDLRYYEHYKAVQDVLRQLNIENKPVVTALNKMDVIEDKGWIERYKKDFSDSIEISALNNINLDALLKLVEKKFEKMFASVSLNIPLKRMDLVDLIYREGRVKSINYTSDSIKFLPFCPP